MSEDKKIGITHTIREKLNFQDERLWKRFSARRLELIDSMALSSRKASEQEDEIKKVAEILRQEFQYGEEYFADFDKLVRAAVQSVRRNRKRSTKLRRSNVKRGRLAHGPSVSPDEHAGDDYADTSPGNRTQFLLEISRLNVDGHDAVYDMSYPTTKVFTNREHSRAAINLIIQPAQDAKPHGGVLLPPLQSLPTGQQQADNEKELAVIRALLLQLIKRSKLCLTLTARPQNEFLRTLGQSAIAAVSALVFEHSFLGLNQTSIGYLLEKIGHTTFLARFYRSLEPESPTTVSLDDETAVVTLQTLVGCCVKDFGFDLVLNQIGEAFYRSILLEYPLVLNASVPFVRSQLDSLHKAATETLQGSNFLTSLTDLAAVATELRSQISSAHPEEHTEEEAAVKTTDNEKKLVVLRFLSSSLEFTYPKKNSAPPRFVELMENAKLAFKLNDNQIFGLRNCSNGELVNSDFDLEKIFTGEMNIQLEIFPQRFQAIPIYELTSAVTSNKYKEDRKIILPPPITHTSPPVLPTPISRPQSAYGRAPLLPKFQPLL